MGQGLKQRLLGVVVLLGLLVLLAPALFRGGDSHPLVKVESTTSLVETPDVPQFVEVLEQAPEPVEVIQPETPEAYYDNQPGNDAEGNLKAWTLQLATFSDKANAKRLEKDLKNEGFSAYTQQFRGKSGGDLFRVFVGPEARTEDLLKVKSDIDKKYKISSLLIKYNP